MRIASWNVNGIRAIARKGVMEPFLEEVAPDVILLQETKATEDQVPEEILRLPGFHTYWSASQARPGYSGTAILSKDEPRMVTKGINVPSLDNEGRVITAHFDYFAVVSAYLPNGGQGAERLKYKLSFYDAFLEYLEKLRERRPVIWGGDVNTAHEKIDLARPKENEKNTGFLPEERAWLDEVVATGWIDTYRRFYPHKEGAYTYWDMKSHARERNVGWRIDYLFVSPDLGARLIKASIHNRIHGSDHCPISLDITKYA
jgi:exodeoxyribonuclease-3